MNKAPLTPRQVRAIDRYYSERWTKPGLARWWRMLRLRFQFPAWVARSIQARTNRDYLRWLDKKQWAERFTTLPERRK